MYINSTVCISYSTLIMNPMSNRSHYFAHLASVFDITATDEGASADGQSPICLRCCRTGCQGRTDRCDATYG